jgi:hypothetical protein
MIRHPAPLFAKERGVFIIPYKPNFFPESGKWKFNARLLRALGGNLVGNMEFCFVSSDG